MTSGTLVDRKASDERVMSETLSHRIVIISLVDNVTGYEWKGGDYRRYKNVLKVD